MDISKLLKFSNFFNDLSKESITKLAAICIPKSYKRKEMLFHEGQGGHTIFLLINGGIQLFKTAPEGKEIVVKAIKPGEVFAEVILFEENDYPVSARALFESKVLLLPKQQMHCLLMDEGFRNDFIKMLIRKQRYLTDRILYLSAYELEDRFFRFLLDQFGKKHEYKINISKKDIALNIGTIPETFSRLIARLEREGKITWKDKTLNLKSNFWDKFYVDI